MRRCTLLLLLLCLLAPGRAEAAITLVTSGFAQAANVSGPPDPSVTLDTTGATLLVAITSGNDALSQVSDSNGNTWTAIDTQTPRFAARLWYVQGTPVVGASHTFTASNSPRVATLGVLAFSGADATAVDGHSANSGTGTVTTGSFTPSGTDVVVIGASIGDIASSTPSGYTVAFNTSLGPAGGPAVAMTYKIFTGSAGSPNPAFVWSNGDFLAVFGAAFDPGGGVAASICNPALLLLRLGCGG